MIILCSTLESAHIELCVTTVYSPNTHSLHITCWPGENVEQVVYSFVFKMIISEDRECLMIPHLMIS